MQFNFFEQAFELCNERIDTNMEEIKDLELRLANMADFNASQLGKAMRQFCEEYTKGNLNEALLASIEKMINTPALNPYNFTIDYDEPCDGEKLLYGKKFVTSYEKFGYPSSWFMFYHWNNFDLDDDIKKIKRMIKKAEKEIRLAKIRLYNAESILSKYRDIYYSATDITDLEKTLKFTRSIKITHPENTFNTIVIIQECIKRGIPVTVVYDDREQKIDINNTKFTVTDPYDYYERDMRFYDEEMRFFDTTFYYTERR